MSKINKEDKSVYIGQLCALQTGVMSYYHLFETVGRADRFAIGKLVYEMASLLPDYFEEDSDEYNLLNGLFGPLCDLDSCDPHSVPGDCEYQDYFIKIFDILGHLKQLIPVDE